MVRNIYLDTWDAIKRYVKFEEGEQKSFWVSILAVAFIISFNDWGAETADLNVGFINFFGALVIVTVTFFGRIFAQKAMGAGTGYRSEYKMWTVGLIFAVVLAFITKGKFWFLIPGGMVVHFMQGNRLGFSKYMLSPFGVGVVSITGSFTNIILAMFWRVLYTFTDATLFHTAFVFNLIWALWSLVPIPPSDGSRMFYGSRMAYMWCVGAVVSAVFLLYSSMNIFLSIFLSFVAGWAWWLIYYIVWERFNWKGNY